MRARRAWGMGVVAGLLSVISGDLSAQTVAGSVTAADGAALAGAVVRLIGEVSDPVTTRLTGPDGRFVVEVPRVGRYSISADMIGYAAGGVGPFEIQAGQTIEIDIRLAADPIKLQGITISAESRCENAGSDGVQTERLWREVSTALEATRVVDRNPNAVYHVELTERRTEARTGETIRSRRRSLNVKGGHPFRSLAAGDLVSGGFVRKDGEATLYFAPDADALLSDEFLATHCFNMTRDDDGTPRVGLTFRPLPGRKMPDVSGTLWMDPSTLLLRSLDYTYWNLERRFDTRELGGRVWFSVLGSGEWLVTAWQIRTPVVADRVGMFALDDQLLGYDEVGGDLIAYDAEGQGDWVVVAASKVGRIEGMAFDSLSGEPLAGARVLVLGFEDLAIADTSGAFSLEGIPPGRYSLTLSHGILDSLGIELPATQVVVEAGGLSTVDLAVPARGTLEAARCGQLASGSVVLTGQVRDDLTGAALAHIVVELLDRGGVVDRETVTSADGWFVLCGVHSMAGWTLRARGLGRVGADIAVVPSGDLVRRFYLSLPLADAVRVQGVVLSHPNGRPLAGVEVVLDGDQRALSDANGRFVFEEVHPGLVRVEARHLAYGSHGDTVLVEGGETVSLRIELAAEAIELEPMTVIVERGRSLLGRIEARGTRTDIVSRGEVDAILERGGVRDFGQLLAAAGVTGLRVTQRLVNYPGPGHPFGGYLLCIESNRRRRSPDCNPVVVYVNGARISDPEWTLEDILDPSSVAAVEFLSPLEAGARFGTGSGDGVLLIYTR